MFACETTPPTEYMFESIKQEAIDNVIRLRNHPSMALWCGDNENVVGWNTWGWDEIHTDEIDSAIYAGYLHISTEILPKAVAEFHPGIDYWASSPASYPGDQPANRKSGDEHDWTIWFGQKPFEAYGDPTPRFVSEYGVQAFPDMATIEAFARKNDMGIDTEVMNHRQRSDFSWLKPGMNGNDMILQYIDLYFGEPKDFKSTVYLSQLMQARALKTGIEMHRRVKPYCMGSLYWQINDCWPTVSWASVDYFGRWKSSHYRVRDAFKPFLIVPEWIENELIVDLISDDTNQKTLLLSIYEFPVFDQGEISEIWNKEVSPEFDHAIRLEDFPTQYDRSKGLYFELKDGAEIVAYNILLPERPKDLSFSNPEISIKTNRLEPGRWNVELKGTSYAHGVFIEASVPGVWSDNYFNLPAGKTKTLTFDQSNQSSAPEFNVSSYIDYVK
jgi:beta-mannosidase